MSGNSRLVALALGLLAGIGGLGLTISGQGGGIPLLLISAGIIVSVGIERRYGRQGRQKSVPHSDWRLTGERFFDDETGQPVEVWVDPLTGERRYEPLGDHPRISDPRTHR
jgi:hypothetical protein